LARQWKDNNQIWASQADGVYDYRIGEIENFVIGSIEVIKNITMDEEKKEIERKDQWWANKAQEAKEQGTYIENEYPVIRKEEARRGRHENTKDKERNEFETYICNLFSDLGTYVTFHDNEKPEGMRQSKFSQLVQEFHDNWISNERKPRKKYMDFMKDGTEERPIQR